MNFHSSIENIINEYGNAVEIETNGKKVQSKAFIQPLRYENSDNMNGYTKHRYYLYIGQVANGFLRTDNTIIQYNNKKYVIHNSGVFRLHDKVLYTWAVLSPYK